MPPQTKSNKQTNKQTKLNTTQVLEQKILFHTNINNENICKIVCKTQCLKNGF